MRFSADYLDPAKRSIANAVQVFFKDGSSTPQAVVEYPLGHRRRRAEGVPLLVEKFKAALGKRFAAKQAGAILELCQDAARLKRTPVNEFMDLWTV